MTKTTLIYISTNRTLNIVAYCSIISVYNRPEWSWYKSGIHCITRLDDHCHTKLGFTRNNLRFLKKCGRLISHRKKWASSRREKKREKKRENEDNLLLDACCLMLCCQAYRSTNQGFLSLFFSAPSYWNHKHGKNQHNRNVKYRYTEQTLNSLFSLFPPPHPHPMNCISPFMVEWALNKIIKHTQWT